MIKISGKAVYKGIVLGPVAVLKKEGQQVKRKKVTDADAEIFRMGKAGQEAQKQLRQLYEKAVKEVGEASAAIFEVHQMMLEDEDYLESIHNMIRNELVNAEYAVAMTGDNFSEMFASMDDDYMKARAADVKDVSNRLVRILSGQEDVDFADMEPSVIVADDLSPSETVQMDKSKMLALVTVHGSANSHTAILARMMNIPALIGVNLNLEEVHTGMKAVVDGFGGEIILEPTEEICAQAEKRIQEEQGIMIETPAAVMVSDELAELVDFFSIGTNDLTQYTLAIDRQNNRLDEFYNPHHKAILKMIQIVTDNAHRAGKWAGICGELGADPELTETFVRMGVDELSVAPSMVLRLRKIVREMNK